MSLEPGAETFWAWRGQRVGGLGYQLPSSPTKVPDSVRHQHADLCLCSGLGSSLSLSQACQIWPQSSSALASTSHPTLETPASLASLLFLEHVRCAGWAPVQRLCPCLRPPARCPVAGSFPLQGSERSQPWPSVFKTAVCPPTDQVRGPPLLRVRALVTFHVQDICSFYAGLTSSRCLLSYCISTARPLCAMPGRWALLPSLALPLHPGPCLTHSRRLIHLFPMSTFLCFSS